MPVFEQTLLIARPVPEVFDFFARPANVLRVYPPDLHMQIVEAPERLELGSVLKLKGRRWGIPHQLVSEVTAFEPPFHFTDEQRQGPFRKWVHTHRFLEVPGGTQAIDHFDFEPPGGLLGLMVSAAFIRKDLEKAFAYRAEKIREIFSV